jgi:hypothetical protein
MPSRPLTYAWRVMLFSWLIFSIDESCDPFAEEGMVVHRENPNHESVDYSSHEIVRPLQRNPALG